MLKLIGFIKDFGVKPTTMDDKTVLTGEVKIAFTIPKNSNISEAITEMAREAVVLTMDKQAPKFAGT